MSTNFFELFALPHTFKQDLNMLETNYRAIQSASHPDRFVTASLTEKIQSMQLATLANEAYLTLKNPARRAKYYLQLQNIDAVAETNTTMPGDFLVQQMDWREAIEDAKQQKDAAALENLLAEMQQASKALQVNLVYLLDEKKDLDAATSETRKLIFIDKVIADIDKTIESLDI